LSLVRIVSRVDDDLKVTGTPGDNADSVAVSVLELEPQADTGAA
jgi:hypothetical protein